MAEPTFFSLLPPVVAIVLAIITRQVYISLFLGIWIGWFVHLAQPGVISEVIDKTGAVLNLSGSSGVIAGTIGWIGSALIRSLAAALEGLMVIFADAGNTKVIIFSTMVGSLITFTQLSGGMAGLVNRITNQGDLTRSFGATSVFWYGIVAGMAYRYMN